MLEYCKANVDITIIIDNHDAVAKLTRRISNPESIGREMQKLFLDKFNKSQTLKLDFVRL